MNRLERILKYASKNVSYYKSYSGHNIDSFPVVDKNIIREKIHLFVSGRYEVDKLRRVTTSGSTGTPFSVFWNTRKSLRSVLDTLLFLRKAGYSPLSVLYYGKVWNDINKWPNWKIRFSRVFPLDVRKIDKSILEKISDNRGFLIIYPSSLASILSSGYDIKRLKLKGVVTTSEGLDKSLRINAAKLLGTSVYGRYSNVENGIIAQQVDDSEGYLVNSKSFYVEIFSLDNNDLLPDGELGRIVVTDFYNKAVPMIRYDTGDLGRKVVLGDSLFLFDISGRKMDAIFDNNGNVISSFIITNTMWDYTDILKYKFKQMGRYSYEFEIVPREGFNRAENEKKLLAFVLKQFGSKSELSFVYSDGIPMLKSWKEIKVVNTWFQNKGFNKQP